MAAVRAAAGIDTKLLLPASLFPDCRPRRARGGGEDVISNRNGDGVRDGVTRRLGDLDDPDTDRDSEKRAVSAGISEEGRVADGGGAERDVCVKQVDLDALQQDEVVDSELAEKSREQELIRVPFSGVTRMSWRDERGRAE